MRKKFFMVFMMVAAISLVGCEEKTTTTEVQATPEPTEAPATTEEPEQEKEKVTENTIKCE